MNYLVTGGAGFIGSHLCNRLLKNGDCVVCVDNLQRGDETNIRGCIKNAKFKFYKVDATDQESMEAIMRDQKTDMVYHLAANTDLWESMKDPELEHHCTFLTTQSILNAMRNTGVKKLFFSSTSVIYGEQKGSPFTEADELHPITYYGSAKMASEAYIYSFSYMNDIDALIYRFSNIIGDKMTHGVIRDFIFKLKNDPTHLDVRGNGYQTKPYLYVDELLSAILMIGKDFNGVEIYNVGATSCTNVRFIAEAVIKEMGLEGIPINYEDKEMGYKGDIVKYEYNVDKINKRGWHSIMSSDETVLRTVKELVREFGN